MMDLADLIVRDVAELPDRTSPDDQPDMLLVTADELRGIIRERQWAHSGSSATPCFRDEAMRLRNMYNQEEITGEQLLDELEALHARFTSSASTATSGETPRTDAAVIRTVEVSRSYGEADMVVELVDATVARQLERELAAAVMVANRERDCWEASERRAIAAERAQSATASPESKQLDAIAAELGLPAEARQIAGCDVLAHYVRDLHVNYERVSNQLNDLILLCKKQGFEVTMETLTGAKDG